MFDKEQIRQALLATLQEQRDVLAKAVAIAVDATTHEDAKSEGKYDTRAIESGYIAGAQAQRLKELDAMIHLVGRKPLPAFGPEAPIAETAIVTVEDSKGSRRHYLLLGGVGAINVESTGTTITTLSPASRLGQDLLERETGDSVDEDMHSGKQLTILEVE